MDQEKKGLLFTVVMIAMFVVFGGIQSSQVKHYTAVLDRQTENRTPAASSGAVSEKKKPVVYLTFDDGPSSLPPKYINI